jgi:type III secretion system (T3SS) inner membrane Yop/YscD-like protein/FHA domain-containing protein
MNAFMKACKIAGPLQLAVRGPSPNESGVRLLHQPFALVGCDMRADVPLDYKFVSRRHVYLQIVEGQAFWLDLDSRSGTSAEGQMRKFGWLEAGKSIQIGPYELERLASSGPAPGNRETRPGPHVSPLVARSYDDQALPDVSLEFLNGPSRSACWPMNRVMSLIGSASGCKFRLADTSVSPFHCSLLRTPSGLWIVDLLGPDGISVNDALVRYALLAADDVLRVGRYRIRMRIRFASRDSDRSASEESRRIPIAETRPTSQLPLTPVFSNGDSAGSPSLPAHSWQMLASEALASRDTSGQATSIECISPAVNVPTRLEKGEITESLLVPLMNQFGQMQQQMLDQFQQAISMIVQMFGTLHRDQMVTIREELDQLRDLTREFHALKLELAARSQDQTPVVLASTSTALGDSQISGVGSSVQERIESEADARVTPAAARTPPDIASILPILSAVDGSGVASSTQAPLSPSGFERLEVKEPQPQPGESNLESERDVMVWLHQRMIVLQQERESRWRKILKLLPGLS